MGRKRNIFIREFFDYDNNTKSSVCKACSARFMGENITNLKRHMIQAHIELYKQETEDCEDGNMEDKRYKQKIKFTVEISNKEITDSCLDIVTKHSLPLTFFDSNAFRVLTQQMFEGLKMQPINSQSMRDILNKRYFQIKTHIVKTIKGSFISIILDKVTLQKRSVLCINMQIVENRKLVIYTLAVRDIENGPINMEFIKSLLEKVLDEFEISIEQIYTITMENNENILQDLEVAQEEKDVGEEYILATDALKQPEKPLFKEEQKLPTDNDNLLLADIFNNSEIIALKNITDVIQLAIEDFFSESDIEYILQNSRWAIETFTAPSFHNTLQLLNIEKPLKDKTYLWITTFKMLETLLNIKDAFVKTTATDPLEKVDVKDVLLQHLQEPLKQINLLGIKELVAILRPVYECTIMLEKQQLFLVDFYKSWLNLKSNLKSNSSERSAILYSCLENRECQLFNKEVLNSARFLDPLLYRTLNPYEKDNARTHLKELVAKLIKIKPRDNSNRCSRDVMNSKPSTSSSSQNYMWDDTSNSSLLKELSVNSPTKEEMDSAQNRDIQAASNEIDLFNPPLLDADLMEYWDSKKYIIPYLKKLAYIIHAVPVGRVSMEKALTALQFKLDKQREELLDDLLDTIMFIKLNQNSEE